MAQSDISSQVTSLDAIDRKVRYIPKSYAKDSHHELALQLILAAVPEWAGQQDTIELVQCTDGITNTLLKVFNRRPGITDDQADQDAVMLRAYGPGTSVLIDRARETENHERLMAYGLVPPLLARFQNGLIYRYVPGVVPSPTEMGSRPLSLAIARRLAQWHALVPCHYTSAAGADALGGLPGPNLWTVIQKWIRALPVATEQQRRRQQDLEAELAKCVNEFAGRPGLGEYGLVFAHCDLLSGNVIVLPKTDDAAPTTVSFIDYEYATPAPAAFDIANHFAEWVGFECNYSALPTRSQRREFVQEYIRAYYDHLSQSTAAASTRTPLTDEELAKETDKLLAEVDEYRGIPGLFWGVWSAVQALISEIHFDYGLYAELRLSEYWAWRAQREGTLATKTERMQLRERRWAQE